MVLKGWFSSRPDMKSKTTGGGTLTDSERTILARLESAVDEALPAVSQMIAAGKALHEIKSRQLYRDSAATWPDYVTNRFRMSARRADQLVVFAGLTAAIEAVSEESGTVVPVLSERAVRPLAGMAVEDAKDAIRQAVADGGLTPRLRVPGGIVTIELNKAGVASGATIATLLTAAIEAASREAA
jgi:hypothetical protein